MTDYAETVRAETKMYGMTVDSIRMQYMTSITAKLSGQEMVVMGILSDVQEMVAMGGRPEAVRKQLNIAKFILCEMMDAKEAV